MDNTVQLYNLLKNSAERFPDHTSLVFGEQNITYSQLHSRCILLAQFLQTNHIGSGDRIAIYTNKSIDFVVAQFAILSLGAAYLPVDFLAPAERNKYIVENCEARAIIIRKELSPHFEEKYHRVAELPGELALLISKNKTTPSPGGLAYILYTSGSTGKPKGVMYSHAGAQAFIDWGSRTFRPTENDIFSSHAPFHFDLSIFDLFVSIKHGARLVLIDEETAKSPLSLAPLISKQRISIWYSTPTVLSLIANFGKPERYNYDHLRMVLFAGEVFPVQQFNLLKEKLPHPRYFNLYGPTETNVCTWYAVPEDISGIPAFPIGKCCEHYESMISPGNELLIHGAAVMMGYWNSEEQTKNAFYTDQAGKTWYRTGDIVELNDRSELVYKGRMDRMVKRHGYRVELAEVELALSRHPAIIANAVVSKTKADGTTVFYAYVVCPAPEHASVIKMLEYCTKNLPAYMIPNYFYFLDELPQTASNKIDYQTLKQLH